MDIFAATKSVFIWNVSPRMEEVRSKIIKRRPLKQLVVPVPIDFEGIGASVAKEKDIYSLVYAGSLREEIGLELAIEALYELKDRIPNLKLTIIGEGPSLEHYLQLVNKRRLKDRVAFLRYMESRSEFVRFLSSHGIGLALYKPLKNSFIAYADVGKVKTYAACKLPIIMTEGTYTAEEVRKAKAGIVIGYEVKALEEAIIKIISSEEVYKTYSESALRYA